MSLKPKKASPVYPSAANNPPSLNGPWGRMNSSPETVRVLRFCQGSEHTTQKTHSYPYRVIASWHWSKSVNYEELTIKASADRITVRGRGLDRLVEALERGALEVIIEAPEEQAESAQHAVWVGTIEVSRVEND